MNVGGNITLSAGVVSAGAQGSAAAHPAEAKASFKNALDKNVKVARDFEAMLLTPVLESLQKTFSGPEADADTPGASDYRRMGTEALAQSIAAGGGIGIARLILRSLESPNLESRNLEPRHLAPPKVLGSD